MPVAPTAASPGSWHTAFVGCPTPVSTYSLSSGTLPECAFCLANTLTGTLCKHMCLLAKCHSPSWSLPSQWLRAVSSLSGSCCWAISCQLYPRDAPQDRTLLNDTAPQKGYQCCHLDVVCRLRPSTAHGPRSLQGWVTMGHLRWRRSLLGITAIRVCLRMRSHRTHFCMPRVGHGGAHSTVTLPRASPREQGTQVFWPLAEGSPSWPLEGGAGWLETNFFLRQVCMVPGVFGS